MLCEVCGMRVVCAVCGVWYVWFGVRGLAASPTPSAFDMVAQLASNASNVLHNAATLR